MAFIVFQTPTSPIVINTDHIIFFRPAPRQDGITFIEITNPTPDEIGYLRVSHPFHEVDQMIRSTISK